MEKDIFKQKWAQIKDDVKWWWIKINDDDLERANGNFEVFIGLLQEKYGYTRQHAINEINRHMLNDKKAKKKPKAP